MNFVDQKLYDATKVYVLIVDDTFTRFSPAIEPRRRWRGSDVVDVLERISRQHGLPRSIRIDQGPEFISKNLELWVYRRGVIVDFSRPDKPTDNAYIESPHGEFRMQCLNVHLFTSLDEMRRICEAWRRDYNEVRPHSATVNMPPVSEMSCSDPRGPA